MTNEISVRSVFEEEPQFEDSERPYLGDGDDPETLAASFDNNADGANNPPDRNQDEGADPEDQHYHGYSDSVNQAALAAASLAAIDETKEQTEDDNNNETAAAAPQSSPKKLFSTLEAQSMEHLYYEYEDADAAAAASGMLRQESAHGMKAQKKMSKRKSMTATAAPFDITYHPGRIMGYSPPCQRQKWGDTQVLPRVNWGDLFFDLHYVAATYNVSNILVLDPSWTGLLYAAGTFLPIMNIWVQNTAYSARFTTHDDLYHRVLQVVQLVVLATSVLHIRPVEIMEHASSHISMFVFALSLCLERLIAITNYLEIYCYGVGQREVLKHVAFRDISLSLISLAFFGSAAAVAAAEFFPRSSDDDYYSDHRLLAESKGKEDGYSKYSETETQSPSSTNVPIFLCLGAFCFNISFVAFMVVCLFPKDGSHKKRMVPLNIDFLIHRYGEWTHLMLGESIFSILIVDVSNESSEYFGTFYASLLTVIMLQYLHFKSEPHSAHGHASRRDKGAGVLWNFLVHVYSFALTSLGAAYTFFLRDFEEEEEEKKRNLLSRYLAASEDDEYGHDSKRKRAAHLFCGSLAIILFSLDGMGLSHIGWKRGYERCFGNATRSRNLLGGALLALRLGLWVFTATLSQWTIAPESLAVLGLTVVIGQLFLLKLVSIFLSKSEELDGHQTGHQHNVQVRQEGDSSGQDGEEEEMEEIPHPFEEQRRSIVSRDSTAAASWPNVTTPQVAEHSSLRSGFYNRTPHSSNYNLNANRGGDED